MVAVGGVVEVLMVTVMVMDTVITLLIMDLVLTDLVVIMVGMDLMHLVGMVLIVMVGGAATLVV